MYSLANTHISILRGTKTDEFNDVIDDNSAIAASGIQAALINTTDKVLDPATGIPKTVHSFLARIDPRTDVLLTDRIQDQTDQVIYAIENITVPKRAGYLPDMELDLRNVD